VLTSWRLALESHRLGEPQQAEEKDQDGMNESKALDLTVPEKPGKPNAGFPRRSHTWVRGPAWDGIWVLSALWLVPLALWLAHGYSDPESSPLDNVYLGLTALFWIGHRFCSAWVAYCTEAFRPLRRSEPVRFIILPLLVAVACFAFLLPDDVALPWTRAERIVGMAIVDYALLTYHFAAQHFGALSIYRTRAERGGCELTRRLDRTFALCVGGAVIFFADILAGSVSYQHLWIDRWLITAWVVSQQGGIREVLLLVLLVATALMLVAEARAQRPSLPRALYVLGLAAMAAIALRPRSPFLFVVIWTSQHWMLSVGLASQTPSGEPAPASGAVRRAFHALNARPWAILLVLMVSSVLLLPVFEVEANREGGTYYGDRIFGAIAGGLRTSFWAPALTAAGFATGFVHYLLDRNVYRMSDPRVRSAACGLIDGQAN
jgi:hypothetical protein